MEGRFFRPEMLVLGATGRNSGKTELACRILRHFVRRVALSGLKVTTVERADGSCPRGGSGCGVCSSLTDRWCLTHETDAETDKDTARLLASGAEQVLWLRVLKSALREGAEALFEGIPADTPSVCESNSLNLVVEPGLFLQVRNGPAGRAKASARAVAHLADAEVVSDGIGFDLSLDDLSIVDGQWVLRRPALGLAIGDPARSAQISEALRAHVSEVTCVQGAPGPALAEALGASRHPWCLVALESDARLDAGLVNALFRRREDADVVFLRRGLESAEPHVALFHRRALASIRKALLGGARSLADVARGARVRELRVEEAPSRPADQNAPR